MLSVVKGEEEEESQAGVETELQVVSALKSVDESLLDQYVELGNSDYCWWSVRNKIKSKL